MFSFQLLNEKNNRVFYEIVALYFFLTKKNAIGGHHLQRGQGDFSALGLRDLISALSSKKINCSYLMVFFSSFQWGRKDENISSKLKKNNVMIWSAYLDLIYTNFGSFKMRSLLSIVVVFLLCTQILFVDQVYFLQSLMTM